MKAFKVDLPPGTILIRVGEDTDGWGKPYDYSLPMLPNGTLVGLCKNPEQNDVGKFTSHHMRAIKELVEGELGRMWDWDRLNHDNHRTVRRRVMAEKKDQGFEVTITITRDGNKFTTYQWHNMSKATMQKMQGAVAGSLVALGNEETGVE